MKRKSVVVGKKWKKGDGGVEAKVSSIELGALSP